MRTFIENNLQTLLNHYLALDPESETRLEMLQNKIITIEFLNVASIFQLIFEKSKVVIKISEFATPHTIIKGTPLSLLRMTLARENRKRFFADDVTIEGDLELGQKVIDLFDSLEIDWEEYLSHWIGDVSAHQLGRFSKRFKNFNQNLHATLLQNIKEYIHEEVDLFPPSEALHDFYQDIDNLRMDTDRLEARIERVTKMINTEEEA